MFYYSFEPYIFTIGILGVTLFLYDILTDLKEKGKLNKKYFISLFKKGE